MAEIKYYLVDVFTWSKYGGNPLAVFIDYKNIVNEKTMLKIARELNFSEVTFVKENNQDKKFSVRIFTPEYEVPFAGHPSLGTAFVISKYLIPKPKEQIVLGLKHSELPVDITSPKEIDKSYFVLKQSDPRFLSAYTHQEIADGLGIEFSALDGLKPIEEVSTGLPYIIVPIISLAKINEIKLDARKVMEFLVQNKIYKTNSPTGLSTSLFFITEETFEKQNDFNARMFCVEQESLVEDAATGSANSCLLAYLLKNGPGDISATVEQGFQINRESYINLEGRLRNNEYTLKIGGQVVDVSHGNWKV